MPYYYSFFLNDLFLYLAIDNVFHPSGIIQNGRGNQWKLNRYKIMKLFNRCWRISTAPNTTKFFLILFKLIQQSNMVILSCLAKKNQNLNARKKSSVYYWKLRFQARNPHKPPFSVINWTFFPRIQILIFLREATQNDHIRLLYKFENDQKNFGCVGSCGYAPASVKSLL